MRFLQPALLGFSLLQAYTAFAQGDLEIESVEEIPDDELEGGPSTTPNLAVKLSATFPQSEIFGVKLVNGHATQAVISVTNNEPEPVKIFYVGGSLMQPAGAPNTVVSNLSTIRYNLEIPAGQSESITYTFKTDMHPTDIHLSLAAVLQDSKSAFYTYAVFNETVSVVEAPVSLLDPQILFLYLVLAAAFGGTCWFIYTTWITTLFPQQKRRGKGGERAKKSSGGSKKVDPADQTAVLGADGPAVASGSKAYDESWIPAQHLQRPEAKRVGSGRNTPKTKAKSGLPIP